MKTSVYVGSPDRDPIDVRPVWEMVEILGHDEWQPTVLRIDIGNDFQLSIDLDQAETLADAILDVVRTRRAEIARRNDRRSEQQAPSEASNG